MGEGRGDKMRKFMAIITFIMAAFFIFAAFADDVAMAMGGHGNHGHGRPGGGCIPEIDPSMASSAIALLTCGLLILTNRFGRKK
jgi:hypothetical protein